LATRFSKSFLHVFMVSCLAFTACATTRGFVRPTGATTPLTDHAGAWQAATAECRGVQSYRGDLRLSGKVAGERIRSVTLGLAVDATGRLGFETQVMGSSIFRLGGTTANATLLLRADNRVVRGPAGEIVEALIGVRLDPARLLAVLAGCVATSLDATAAERLGAFVQVTLPDATVFLSDDGRGWRPRAGTFEQLLVDYQRIEAGYPHQILITSEPGRSPSVSLSIAVRSLDINPVFTGAEFHVTPPDGAIPISLDELRAAGPLGGK